MVMEVKRLKNAMINKVGLKISAILLTILLWIFVTSEHIQNIELDEVSVDYKNLPLSMMIMNELPKSMKVHIRGKSNIVTRITFESYKIWLDLGDVNVGENQITLRREHINIPRQLELTGVIFIPSRIKVNIEKLIVSSKWVEPNITGAPVKDKEIKLVKVEPQLIEIKGPQSLIAEVGTLATEVIDISRAVENIEKEVPVILPSESLMFKGTDKVKVLIEISPKLLERKIKGLPIKIIPDNENVEIQPDKLEILIKGEAKVVSKLDDSDIDISMDISNLEEGDYELFPRIGLPEGITLLGINPKVVKIKIK